MLIGEGFENSDLLSANMLSATKSYLQQHYLRDNAICEHVIFDKMLTGRTYHQRENVIYKNMLFARKYMQEHFIWAMLSVNMLSAKECLEEQLSARKSYLQEQVIRLYVNHENIVPANILSTNIYRRVY